jgi:predicted nucleotidyltransferase
VDSLEEASLTATERRVIERLVRDLQAELGADLHAVWLYGSRARAEPPEPDSDIDLIVVSSRGGVHDDLRVIELTRDAALAEGENPFVFSPKLYDPARIAQRREIRSFFMQAVDRDKIVLFGAR